MSLLLNTQLFADVYEVQEALKLVAIWGFPIMGEHFVLHDDGEKIERQPA